MIVGFEYLLFSMNGNQHLMRFQSEASFSSSSDVVWTAGPEIMEMDSLLAGRFTRVM